MIPDFILHLSRVKPCLHGLRDDGFAVRIPAAVASRDEDSLDALLPTRIHSRSSKRTLVPNFANKGRPRLNHFRSDVTRTKSEPNLNQV